MVFSTLLLVSCSSSRRSPATESAFVAARDRWLALVNTSAFPQPSPAAIEQFVSVQAGLRRAVDPFHEAEAADVRSMLDLVDESLRYFAAHPLVESTRAPTSHEHSNEIFIFNGRIYGAVDALGRLSTAIGNPVAPSTAP